MLNQLLPDLEVPAVAIHGISEDSRSVRSGDLFCAVVGENTDGRNYISAAISNGAAAVLSELPLMASVGKAATVEPAGDKQTADKTVDKNVPIVAVANLHDRLGEIAARFFEHPSQALTVFAVTGTNGKTSFTRLLAQALGGAAMACGMIGTMGYGRPDSLKEPGLTTPSAIDIQRKLRDLVDTGCKAAVLEASSHGLSQGRLAHVNVDTAVLTNITHDHLDYHKTFEAYQAAKEQLFHMGSVKTVVVNKDDAFSTGLIQRLNKGVQVVGYSLGKPTDVTLVHSDATADGVEISVLIANEKIKTKLPLFGAFNIQNVLAVIATLHSLGWAATKIESSLGVLSPVPGRMDVMRPAGKPTLIVDYAHTPDALEKALMAVREHFPDQHVTCVFGCGGDRDRSKRPVMGEIASRFSDRVVLTSDNPRSESPEEIIREIQAGVNATDVLVSSDRAEAIRRAIGMAEANSIVLIAGKGHETYQELASGRVPYSDYAVIDEVMRAGVVTNGEDI